MSAGKFIQHKHGNVALDNLKGEFEGFGEIIIKTTENEEAIITKNSVDNIVEFLPVNRFKTINGESLIVSNEDGNIEIKPTEVNIERKYTSGVEIAKVIIDNKETTLYAPVFDVEGDDALKELLDSKADVVHGHNISDINGLGERLSTIDTNIDNEITARKEAISALTDDMNGKFALKADASALTQAVTDLNNAIDAVREEATAYTDTEIAKVVSAYTEEIQDEINARTAADEALETILQELEAEHDDFLNVEYTGETIIKGNVIFEGTVISRKGFYEDPEGDPNIEINSYVTESQLGVVINNTLSKLGSTLSADKGYYISGITQENGKIVSVGVAELPKPTSDGEVVTNVQISDTLSEGEVIAKVIIDNNETILYAPKYSSEINNLTSQYNTLTSQYNTLSGNYETINSQISDLTSENETITTNIQGNLEKIENVSGSVNTLSTELSTHKSDNSHLSENDRNVINNLSNDSINFSGKTITADAYFQTSDERVKTFGDEIEVDFEKLSKLRKSYFAYNTNPNKQEIGVSAQEVKEIYPEIVNEDENGILSVDYCKLSVIALSAVDKLNERLNKIEEKLGL